MIARVRPGGLEIRSVDGGEAYQLDFGRDMQVTSAALDETGTRLALTATSDVDEAGCSRTGPALLLFDIQTGRQTALREDYSDGPVWFPGESRLAFSTGTDICTIDADGGDFDALYRYSTVTQGPTHIGIDPGKNTLSFVTFIGDDQRIGVVDLRSGKGRLLPVSCYHYCWWDEETILYVLGSGLKLLDIGAGKSRTLLRDLQPLLESGALASASETWAEWIARDGACHEVRVPACCGDRVYFGARVTYPQRRRSAIPFLKSTAHLTYSGVFSVARDKSDFRAHIERTEGMIFDFVFVNSGKTLAAYVEKRNEEGRLSREWVYAGEGAEEIPCGFGPLPKASLSIRGNCPSWDVW